VEIFCRTPSDEQISRIQKAADFPSGPPPGPIDWVVYLLDQAQGNFLFRGDLPLITNTEYNYNGLVSILQQKAQLPSQFYLVDIDFTYDFWPDNESWVETSQQFWSNNSNLGEFIHWPLYGDLDDPNDYSSSQLQQFATTLPQWQLDQLPQKMQTIYTMLNTKYTVPHIFYCHCQTGVDRTGEFSISYGITYLSQSFQVALNFSDSLCEQVHGRPIMVFEAFAAEWYCYYMNFVKGTQFSCHLPN